MQAAIGIDIGSTCAKAVVLNENGEFLFWLAQPTGWSTVGLRKIDLASCCELNA